MRIWPLPLKIELTAIAETEDCDALLSRILAKAKLDDADENAIRSNRDGAGVVYEFDGDRWALEDGECETDANACSSVRP